MITGFVSEFCSGYCRAEYRETGIYQIDNACNIVDHNKVDSSLLGKILTGTIDELEDMDDDTANLLDSRTDWIVIRLNKVTRAYPPGYWHNFFSFATFKDCREEL